MNSTVFTQQVEAMSHRLASRYQEINESSALSPSLLPAVLKELGIASERLRVATEMLFQQNQKLIIANEAAELERQHYRGLLEFVPDACLITNEKGLSRIPTGLLLNCSTFKRPSGW